VRLPKACRFVARREALVRREARRVIREPADEWSADFRSCPGSVVCVSAITLAELGFGVVAAALSSRGQPIGVYGPLVAAHALSLGPTVVTNDTRHFGRVPGLTVENRA
jgi:predicted nucleic acid-binding protein